MNITGSDKIEMLFKDGKFMLLIGDYHFDYRKEGCSYFKETMILPKFIEHVIASNQDKEWDFYLEQGVITTEGKPSAKFLNHLKNSNTEESIKEYKKYITKWGWKKNEVSSLGLTNRYFQSIGCFAIDRSKCPDNLKNARYHFIDIRQEYFGDCNFGLVDYHKNFFENLFDAFDTNNFERFIDDIIFSYKHLLNECSDTKSKVNDQLTKSKLSTEINEFFKEKLENIRNLMKEALEILEEGREEILRLFREDLENDTLSAGEYIIGKFTDINAFDRFDTIEETFKTFRRIDFFWEIMFIYRLIMMDNYALGRMTKSYNKNIIVLAGMNHISRYRTFFTEYGGWKPVWHSKQINKKCSQVPCDMFPKLQLNNSITVKSLNSVDVGKKSNSKPKSKSFRRKKKKSLKKKKNKIITFYF